MKRGGGSRQDRARRSHRLRRRRARGRGGERGAPCAAQGASAQGRDRDARRGRQQDLSDASMDEGGARDKLRAGDAVEARYRGGSKWYPGKIARERRDGTFDIAYDDGEREDAVASRNVRAVRGAAARGAQGAQGRDRDARRGRQQDLSDASMDEGGGASTPCVGDAVEARYRGGRWLPGLVTRERRDGSFDIEFDNGRLEGGVDATFVRLRDESGQKPRRQNRGAARDLRHQASDDEPDILDSRRRRGDRERLRRNGSQSPHGRGGVRLRGPAH